MTKTRTQGVYRRPDSKYYWIAFVGLDGKIIRESAKTKNLREAQALLTNRKNLVLEGKNPQVRRIKNYSFNDLCEVYLPWAERQKAFKSKALKIKQLSDEFGHLPLRRFSTLLVEQFQTKRMERNQPATVNRLLATLKHMFTKAVEWEMVEEAIQKKIQRVKLEKEENRRLRYLTIEECHALLRECPNHLKPIVITAMNTGMRRSEILSLKWEQVDLTHGFILLNKTKNGERREVPINATLEGTLRSMIRRLDSPFLFHGPKTGKPLKDIKTGFKAACRRAGIRDFRFHDLRHTFASHLVMNGVDITTVKELLGHKTLTMTLRYAHLAPSHKAKAVDILSRTMEKSA